MATQPVTEIKVPRTSEQREVQGFYIQLAAKIKALEERIASLEAVAQP